MQGSLSMRHGVLWVGRHEKTAHVRPYDLDGRALGPGFSFRDERAGRSEVGGLEVDADHRVWVADTVASRVRAFTVSGAETGGFGSAEEERDRPGVPWSAADVAAVEPVEGADDGADDAGPRLLVACRGERRHGLQLFTAEGAWIASLRSEGSPLALFRDVVRVAARGRLAWACEARAGRVQVFRDGDFHFHFSVPPAPGATFEPRALAPLADGRLVVAAGGPGSSALLLLDASGRLLRELAGHGVHEGAVFEPNDVVLEESDGEDARRRVVVVDRDAERVQVFTLDGRCYGRFESLPGEPAG